MYEKPLLPYPLRYQLALYSENAFLTEIGSAW